eukprot:41314-Eustigmatos_ZCMA.PRE.1
MASMEQGPHGLDESVFVRLNLAELEGVSGMDIFHLEGRQATRGRHAGIDALKNEGQLAVQMHVPGLHGKAGNATFRQTVLQILLA